LFDRPAELRVWALELFLSVTVIMPIANTSDEGTPIYNQFKDNSLKDPSPTRLRATNPNSIQLPVCESRSTTTARPYRRDSQDVQAKSQPNERDSRKDRDLSASSTASRTTTTTATTTTTITDRQRTTADHRDARSGPSGNSSDGSSSESSVENEYAAARATVPKEQDLPVAPTGKSHHDRPIRVNLGTSQNPTSYSQATRPQASKDPQHPSGTAEGAVVRGTPAYHHSDRRSPNAQDPSGVADGTAARASPTHHHSDRKAPNAQDPPGHLPEDERQDRMLDIRQSPQGPGYGQGIMDAIMSVIPSTGPPPPKDKYQLLKEEHRQTRNELKQAYGNIENYDRELRRKHGELRHVQGYVEQLQHDKQRLKDFNSSLQNELNNIHQQLEDAKNLSEVRGKELFGAQVFLTKADTLSISEVGERVTALNEEIFQAAATLGETLIHKRYEPTQDEFNAAAAESREMVGEKITNLLITQSQKPEPEVNPLLIQVVLQIFMVKFCVSKILSWYPGDSAIGEFLTAIYSDIRSTGKHLIRL
jgi:hypothetical protein